jgi:hypothetical protein
MQHRKFICIFSFLLSSQHVSSQAGHHQVLLFMLKLSNCTAHHFFLVLLSTKLFYGLIIFIKTKTARRVEHNHNRTTAGRYNINKEGTSGRRPVRGRDFKNKNKNKF